MSTNFYIKKVKPVEIFPEFHLGKRSCGWKFLFQANADETDMFPEEVERPVITCLDDIRAAVDSGDWEIVNEYGDHVEYEDFIDYAMIDFPAEAESGKKRRTHVGIGIHAFERPDGTEWTHDDFR